MRRIGAAALLVLWPTGLLAQDWARDPAARDFVESNVLATFYHELGHALVDTLQLPVLGREEDAADTLSALLIHDLWQEEPAANMVYHTAGAFLAYAAEAEAGGHDLPYWDEHALDMQRYYNLICLFYGANPDEREEMAIELELPQDRAQRCPDEFALAADSWGVMLEGLAPGPEAKGLVMVDTKARSVLRSLVATEVAELNKTYGLPEEISVSVEPCGQANAFYHPDARRITICTEYADDLGRLWRSF
ncbi:MAG: hypothetical protein E6Q73_00525 [Pseudorhodobacter sp.]|nr:MAG: hypothetical protein E6Q73_00525 [Pseudorhodobacter sp.]